MERIVSHAEMRELLGAYAVHALDDDEMALVAEHLEDCATCQDEVDDLLDASASLGLMDAQPVSGAVWSRVSAEVATLPRSGDAPPVPNPPSTRHDQAVAPIIRLDAAREARRDRRTKWKIAIASAAAAAALTAPLTSVFTGSSAPSLAALAEQAAKEPGTRRITLAAADGTRLAEAVLTTAGRGYVRQDTLPPLPAGSTYQLWALADGKPVSAGVLGADPGTAAFTVDARIDALAISVEPAAGSVAPSSTPVAVGKLV